MISTASLLHWLCIHNEILKSAAHKYKRFVYQDWTLMQQSSETRNNSSPLWVLLIPILRSPVVLASLITVVFERLEERARHMDWRGRARYYLIVSLYGALVLGCFISFIYVFRGLASFRGKVDTKTWTFGQIIAITTWALPMCEYVHLELRKYRRESSQEGDKIKLTMNHYRWNGTWLPTSPITALETRLG